MSGSGSFTHREIVTATEQLFSSAAASTVDSLFIARILIGDGRYESSLNSHQEAGGKIMCKNGENHE